uniref:MerR family transcriptional regulator n=1 Tax=Kineococcus terrestris TaxID=2044856 RepID=UPI0035A0E508
MTLTVAAVARRLGVAPATLRTWDRRYGLGPSEHTAGAHRRYSATDLARLVVMRRLTLEGVAPAEAAGIAATTAVGDGGFALASVSTIPASVIEAAVTDAAAIAGPGGDLDPSRGLAAPLPPPGAPGPAPAALTPRPRAGRDDGRDEPRGDGRAGERDEPRDDARDDAEDADDVEVPARASADVGDWAVQSLADRFGDEVRARGAAAAWDAVLAPALATRDTALTAAVDRALRATAVLESERAVLLATLEVPAGPAVPEPSAGLLLRAAAGALAEAGAGSRTTGAGVPVRMLAAAVRRARPPAVLLHARVPRSTADLDPLLRVRPAPLLVLCGTAWSGDVPAGCVRAATLTEAVAHCLAAVTA